MSNLLIRMMIMVALVSCSADQLLATAYTWTVVGPSNWSSPGNWSPGVPAGPPTTGDTGSIASGTATVNSMLAGTPAISVTGTGTLRMIAFTDALTDVGGTVSIGSGGRINWEGTSTSTSLITLNNGAILARPVSNTLAVSSNALALSAGATVTATNLLGTVTRSTLGLHLVGPLSSADNTATLLVQPAVAGQIGVLVLAPTTANTGFIGNVEMQQGPGSNKGVLVLSGTGALSNVNNVTIGNGGILRFWNAVDPFASAKAISVPNGGRIEWEGTTGSYSVTPPTITFLNGSSMGREEASNAHGVSRENIVIDSGATVTVSRINSTVPRSTLGIELRGSLSSGDSSSTLLVDPITAGFLGGVMLAPTTANPYNGNVVIQSTPGPATPGSLVLSGTGALANVNNVSINSGGILRFRNAVDPFVSGKALTVSNGGRVEWEGTAGSYSVTPPTITFLNGSSMGRLEDQNINGVSRENIVIDAGATVTASRINSTVARSTLGVELRGPLSSGDANSTLVINPTVAGFVGSLMLNPTSANPFNGHVVVQPGPGAATPGTLVLSGTGALANVNSLTVESGAILRFRNAVNPLQSAFNINIPTGARMEWEGTAGSYSVTPPTITFQDGSEMGRHEDSNLFSVSRENLVIAPGATVTVRRIATTIARNDLGLRIDGSLSGSADSKIVIDGQASGAAPYTLAFLGPYILNPTVANPYLGTVEVKGIGAVNGHLILQGTGPLANAALLDIQEFGATTVLAAGAANGIDEIRTHNGGTLRFRAAGLGGSTLSNTMLTGDGLIRSEVTQAGNQELNVNQALRPLTLTQVTIAPGFSAGTLNFAASTLTMGANVEWDIEIGATSDLIAIDGSLVLASDTVLNLSDIAGISAGLHVIATTTGTVTGTFGTINALFSHPYILNDVIYGANYIAVEIGQLPIPEPGTGSLTGLIMLGALVARRRRRQA